MGQFSALPDGAARLFRYAPILFLSHHRLLLTWLIFLKACHLSASSTLKGLSEQAPCFMTEWRWRRLLTARYWDAQAIITWLADKVIRLLPKPSNSQAYLIFDSSHKDKRGQKNPWAVKGKFKANGSWFFGLRFITVMLHWGSYRIPLAFKIIANKKSPDYQKETAMFRELLSTFKPPSWVKELTVLADGGFASKENFKFLHELSWQWRLEGRHLYYVIAIARSWKFGNGQYVRDLINHLPYNYYQPKKIMDVHCTRARRYWVYSKKVTLSHIGEVTILLSKKGRNLGPKSVKILVTNRLDENEATTLDSYQRRFLIEVLFKELKSGLGLGKEQVTKDKRRVSNSVSISFMAYLFLLIQGADKIVPGKPWSIFSLQQKFQCQMLEQRFQHDRERLINKLKKAA